MGPIEFWRNQTNTTPHFADPLTYLCPKLCLALSLHTDVVGQDSKIQMWFLSCVLRE